MAYSSITYTSASGTTFALTNSEGDPIPYIRQLDIDVYVNDVLQTINTNYTFNTAGTAIVLNVAVSNAKVLLERITDIADPAVVYTPGSTLTAQDLNNADNQLRYGLQEFQDFVSAGGGVPDGDKGDISITGNGTIWTIDAGVVTETKLANNSVTSSKIVDGTIVNADINASAAIDKTKINGTAITAADTGTVTSTMLADDTIVDADINAAAAIAKTKISGTAITAADTGTVTSTMIADGTIVNADINASAAIDKTKISGTAITAADTGTVTSTMLVDGTIVNADINAAAAIAGTKIEQGSTSVRGTLQLTDSVSSTSTTTAATPANVKTAYDLANTANTTANAALPKAGGTISGNVDNTSTGYFDLPSGTTAQRPGTPNSGMIRFNTDLVQFEGHTGSAWSAVGGGATGGGADRWAVEHDNTITQSYTISTGKNVISAGPITIQSGAVITVPSNSAWSIV